MMKKLILILLIPLLLIPKNVAWAEAAPKLPPDIKGSYTDSNGVKRYYVTNPSAPKPQLRLVEPRSTPPMGTASPKIGSVAGLALQVFLSTPQGQRVLQQGASAVDNVANNLGTQIQKLSDAERTSFVTAWDNMKSLGSKSLELGTTLYNTFFKKVDYGIASAGTGLVTVNADGSQTFLLNGVPGSIPTGVIVAPAKIDTVIGVSSGYASSKYFTNVFFVYDRGDSYTGTSRYKWAYGQWSGSTTTNKVWSGITYSYSTYNLPDALSNGLDAYVMNVTSYSKVDDGKTYTPSVSTPGLNPSTGTITAPSFPTTDTTPAIVQDDTGTKQWEIPNNYPDGQPNIDYVPVTNPSADPVKDTVVIDDQGYQRDPTTDAQIGTDPITEPVPTTDPDPDPTEPTTDPDVGEPDTIQWAKLKAIPDAFTTKFPFSLPWDISKALTAVFGDFEETDTAPVWKFKLHVLGEEYSWDVTFPQMVQDWAPFIRWTFIIFFDVGLIYAVRKLLGGAQ
jgi:hypothetical protein